MNCIFFENFSEMVSVFDAVFHKNWNEKCHKFDQTYVECQAKLKQIQLVISTDVQSFEISPWCHSAGHHFMYSIVRQIERCQVR